MTKCERLRGSQLFKADPGRLLLLLMGTLSIINNNLPFRVGEHEEAVIVRSLVNPNGSHVVLNANMVTHSIIKLYAATKRESLASSSPAKLLECPASPPSPIFGLRR